MRSFCAQQDYLGVLNYLADCLGFMIAIIGTSDQPCWVAKLFLFFLYLASKSASHKCSGIGTDKGRSLNEVMCITAERGFEQRGIAPIPESTSPKCVLAVMKPVIRWRVQI